MFHACNRSLITLITIVFFYNPIQHTNAASVNSENVDIYEMFHSVERPEQQLDDFHILLSETENIEAHIYINDQKEPFNNPINVQVIISCGDRLIEVDRGSDNQKTFCDYSPPQILTNKMQLLFFEFDKNTGQCPSQANVEVGIPLASLVAICQSQN